MNRKIERQYIRKVRQSLPVYGCKERAYIKKLDEHLLDYCDEYPGVTEEDIVKIATSICGLFKDVEERVYRVYLNKSDILREKEPAEHIVEELERKNTVAAYGSLLEE